MESRSVEKSRGPREEQECERFLRAKHPEPLEMGFFTGQQSGGTHHRLLSFYACGMAVSWRQPNFSFSLQMIETIKSIKRSIV
jgi:hypothetical protein